MLHVICWSVLERVIFFVAICGDSSIKASKSKKPNKLMESTVASLFQTAPEPLGLIVERLLLHKLLNIVDRHTQFSQ